MAANLQSVIDSIITQIDFANDEVEVVVERAFLAGGEAMKAMLAIENSAEPQPELDEYVDGIAGLTQSVGTFFSSLTDEQETAYRANLKKVIVNADPAVEAALESFADANLDLTAAILDVNAVIDGLGDGG